MNKAIIAKKMGMSQVFAPNGDVIPVTVLEAGPCPVVQKKTTDKDGYEAVQLAFGNVRANKVRKPAAGHFKKAGVEPRKIIREFKPDNLADYEVGTSVTCAAFAEGELVDVSGTSKGKGFTGVIKRWNHHTGPMAHGSGYHRGVGSMGACSSPSRVFKNKKMSGHWGNEKVTVKNLLIAKIDVERNLLLVKGAVPGAKGSFVVVKQNKKA